MTQVFGRPISLDGHTLSGKTDPQIIHEVLAGYGLAPDEIDGALEDIFSAYLPALQQEVSQAKNMRVHAGVPALLESLVERDDAFIGLLTGNIEPGARIKLEPVGLNSYFEFGAFGSDAHDRMKLPAVACRRAEERFAIKFEPRQVVVIGDARGDVLCAQGYGARAMAVATGRTRRHELEALSPDYLFDSLERTDEVLSAIFAN